MPFGVSLSETMKISTVAAWNFALEKNHQRLEGVEPVAAFSTSAVRVHAAVLFDRRPRAGVILVARNQDSRDSQLAGHWQRVPQRLGGVTASTRRRSHAVSDVSAFVEEEIVQ